MTYRYPHAQIQDVEWFASLLGTYYSDVYEGPPSIRDLLATRVRAHEQTHERLQEVLAAFSRQDIRPLRRDRMRALRFLESDVNEADLLYPRFDGTYRFADVPEFFYGVPVASASWLLAAPAGLVGCPVLVDRPCEPGWWAVEGLEFRIDRDRAVLEFAEDLRPSIAEESIETLYEGGAPSDRRFTIWAMGATRDEQVLQEQFGFALGLQVPSTEGGKAFVNAAFDGIVHGASQEPMRRVVAAAVGAPLASRDGETVQEIASDGFGSFVVTDLAVYRLPEGSTAIVAVGQVLTSAESLCDALTFHELNRAEIPDFLTSLPLGRGFIPTSEFWGELSFPSGATPLIIEENVDGRTKVSFAIHGHPGDVERFWNVVHARGVESGQTLAELLDVRPNPTSEPTAANLPATIDPLRFVIENLLRFGVLVARVGIPSLPAESVGLHALKALRWIMPPGQCLLLFMTISADAEFTAADVEDSAEIAPGVDPDEEILASDRVEADAKIYSVGSRCLS